MSFIKPKTDWKPTDYCNLEDYARIKNNLEELKNIADELFIVPDIIPMAVKDSHEDFLYATDMNRIEDNLELLNNNSYRFSIGDKAVYMANGHTPTWEEYNRIESSTEALYQECSVQYDMIPKLAFTLGNMRGVKL